MNNIQAADATNLEEATPLQQGFHTVMFGFDRAEVMRCIEQIQSENAAKVQALEATLASLRKTLSTTLSDNKILLTKTKEVCDKLTAEKARAEQAVQQAAQMYQQVKKADAAVADYRSRLFVREQQHVVLQSDNTRLKATIDSLNETVTRYEQTREAWEAEQKQKRAELDQLLDEARQAYVRETSAAKAMLERPSQNIAVSIATLKSQLAAVDEKINTATQDLQRATKSIGDVLAQTEEPLGVLSEQLYNFPQTAETVVPQPDANAQALREKIEETHSQTQDTLSSLARAQAQRLEKAKQAAYTQAAATPRVLAGDTAATADTILSKLEDLLGKK